MKNNKTYGLQNKWWWLLIILGLVLLYWMIHHTNHPQKENKIISVVVSQVKSDDIPVYLSALGNLVATDTMTVKTQIDGLLMRVLFKEGRF